MTLVASMILAASALACSTGGDDGGASGGSQDGAPTATTVPIDPGADRAAAEAMLLTPDDMASWGHSPYYPDRPTTEDQAIPYLSDCLGVDDADIRPPFPRATSPTFDSAGRLVVMEVTVAPSAEEAEGLVDLLVREDAPTCYRDAFGAAYVEGTYGNVRPLLGGDVSRIVSGDLPEIGDDAAAIRFDLPLEARGTRYVRRFEAFAIRLERIVVLAYFSSVDTPFPPGEIDQLLRTVIGRAPA